MTHAVAAAVHPYYRFNSLSNIDVSMLAKNSPGISSEECSTVPPNLERGMIFWTNLQRKSLPSSAVRTI